MYILIRTDGYEINTWQFITYEETFEEMKKQYNENIPENWFETEQEMSFINENTAMLYNNGIDVYSWSIKRILTEKEIKSQKINQSLYPLIMKGLEAGHVKLAKFSNSNTFAVFFGTDWFVISISGDINDNQNVTRTICEKLYEWSLGDESYKKILDFEKYLREVIK